MLQVFVRNGIHNKLITLAHSKTSSPQTGFQHSAALSTAQTAVAAAGWRRHQFCCQQGWFQPQRIVQAIPVDDINTVLDYFASIIKLVL